MLEDDAGGYWLVIIIDEDRLQVLGFIDLTAIETMDVIHSVTAANHLSSVVIAGAFHNPNSLILRN
jgi:hypothetical protein